MKKIQNIDFEVSAIIAKCCTYVKDFAVYNIMRL